MNIPANEVIQPWYKQFWAWFILAPLIVVVIVCCITVTIAFKNRDDVVIDNYYKEGRMINMRVEEDKRAEALQLAGMLTFDLEVGEIWLQLSSLEPLPEVLSLTLDHPAKESYDQHLLLKRVGEGRYRADLDRPLQHHWYLRVQPVSTEDLEQVDWRLKGEIDFSKDNSVRLGVNG